MFQGAGNKSPIERDPLGSVKTEVFVVLIIVVSTMPAAESNIEGWVVMSIK